MGSHRRDLVDELARKALAQKDTDRDIFLERACGGDKVLRKEVESQIVSIQSTASLSRSVSVAFAYDVHCLSGSVIGNYRIIRKLGAGGMGLVYLAQDTSLRRNVAIKFLSSDTLKDERAGQRLIREARAAAKLEHPNICTVHEVRQGESFSFIVMQYVDGETLAARIRRQPVPLEEALAIGLQIADALAEAHSKDVIHRDIKPQNVMLTPQGTVKVLDFGLAKTLEPGRPRDSNATTASLSSSSGKIAGTLPYMSPEQVKGEALDAATDVFSFGVMMHELLSGSHPFAAGSDAETIAAILTKPPPPMSVSPVPQELDRILRNCLEKDRVRRYRSGREMLMALKDLNRSLSVPTLTFDNAQSQKTRSRRAFLVLLASLVILSIPLLSVVLRNAFQPHAIDSVAVLPFVNASSDPTIEYLCDGITDNLINTLSRLPNLRVIASTSVFHYKLADPQISFPDPREIGTTLQVRTIVTGKVTRLADKLSVSVELADTRDNSRIWGTVYDRKSSEILTLQEDIFRGISEKLLPSRDREWTAKRGTDNVKAYTLYLNGVHQWNKRTREGTDNSVRYFRLAIDEEPSFGRAYAGLANSYLLGGSLERKDSCELARGAALSALERDDTLAEAYSALAFAKMTCDWNWSASEIDFTRALEINPNYATARHWYSTYLTAIGRHDHALVEIRRAIELDPLSPMIRTELGYALFYARRFDDSITEFAKTIQIYPEFVAAHVGLGYSYIFTDKGDDAIVEFSRAFELSRNPQHHAALAYAYAVTGRGDDARRILLELIGESEKRPSLAYYIAQLCVGLNLKQEALDWLEKACEDRHLQIIYLGVRPVFDSLRDEPRFKDLIKKINLATE